MKIRENTRYDRVAEGGILMKQPGKTVIAFITVVGILTAMLLSGCDALGISMGDSSNQNDERDTIINSNDRNSGNDNSNSQDMPADDDVTHIVYEIPEIHIPSAPGIAVEENEQAVIDYSNTSDGYVMAKYIESTDSKIKLVIIDPDGTQYQYLLEPGKEFDVFPLSSGDGVYEVGVFKQVEDTRYSKVISVTLDVSLTDEFAPFLRPNQFVNFDQDSEAVRKAAQLTAGINDLLEKVGAIYHFVINNIEYDVALAESVQQGYVPDIDRVLESGKGICFDYSSLMAAMLRSQGIPTKLVIGFTGEQYHAWISVYSEEDGWLDNIIFFDGVNWSLVDPTFAASLASSSLAQYIGDGTNYTEMFRH